MKYPAHLAAALIGLLSFILAGCESEAPEFTGRTAYVILQDTGTLKFTTFVETEDGETHTVKYEVPSDDPNYARYLANLPDLEIGEKRSVEPWNFK